VERQSVEKIIIKIYWKEGECITIICYRRKNDASNLFKRGVWKKKDIDGLKCRYNRKKNKTSKIYYLS